MALLHTPARWNLPHNGPPIRVLVRQQRGEEAREGRVVVSRLAGGLPGERSSDDPQCVSDEEWDGAILTGVCKHRATGENAVSYIPGIIVGTCDNVTSRMYTHRANKAYKRLPVTTMSTCQADGRSTCIVRNCLRC